ncbi:MAG: hypothetical protein V5B78_11255 [Desulfohalobiaceae bacterium]
MGQNGGDTSWSDIERLEAEIKDLSDRRQETERELKQLCSAEDVSAGVVYPQRIHNLQQEKLRLDVEIQRRRNLVNRLQWEGEALSGDS